MRYPKTIAISDFFDQQLTTQELKALGDVWVGPDVSLERSVILDPFGVFCEASVVINWKDFPRITLTRGALSWFKWSVRSCLAQSGVEIRFYGAYVTDEMMDGLSKGQSVSVPILLQNHVGRPIEIEGPVMRFFWTDFSRKLTRRYLRECVGKDSIIEGKEGEDWCFRGVDMEEDCIKACEGINPELLKDVCLKLSTKFKFHIPPSKDPIRVRKKKDLPFVLSELSDNQTFDFCIGETVPVKFGDNVLGVIEGGTSGSGMHIRSPLIDPGFVGPIRTETLYGQNFIDLYIYRLDRLIKND